MKKMMACAMILTLSLSLMACSGNGDNSSQTNNSKQESSKQEESSKKEDSSATVKISGTATGSGSTSVEPIIQQLKDEFEAKNPGTTIEYEGNSSGSGITAANENVSMFGCASRELKEEEKAFGMTVEAFAYDGIAAIVHPDNGVSDISMEDLKKIYTGEVTNWKDLGGNDAPIVVVSRENGSGTKSAFEELVGFEDSLVSDATIAEGNGNVQSTVASNPNAIGYVSFTYIDETVKALTVEGVEATDANVKNSTYKISRPFLIFWHEENMNEVATAFVEFIMSAEGQAIVAEKAIPVAE